MNDLFNGELDIINKIKSHQASAQEIYEFAKDNKSANLDLLTDEILKTDDIKYIYLFCLNFQEANQAKIVDYFIQKGKVELLISPISLGPIHFVNLYDNLPENLQNKVAQNIINQNNYENLIILASHKTNQTIKNQILATIAESNNPKYIFKLISAPWLLTPTQYEILMKALIETKDAKYIYDWIKCSSLYQKVQYSEIMKRAIVKANDPYYAYLFALNYNQSEDIQDLENVVINGSAQIIYKFARNIKGANISKLEDAIIRTKDIIYMSKFIKFIDAANKPKLEDAILNEIKETPVDIEKMLNIEDEIEENNRTFNDAYQISLIKRKLSKKE